MDYRHGVLSAQSPPGHRRSWLRVGPPRGLPAGTVTQMRRVRVPSRAGVSTQVLKARLPHETSWWENATPCHTLSSDIQNSMGGPTKGPATRDVRLQHSIASTRRQGATSSSLTSARASSSSSSSVSFVVVGGVHLGPSGAACTCGFFNRSERAPSLGPFGHCFQGFVDGVNL